MRRPQLARDVPGQKQICALSTTLHPELDSPIAHNQRSEQLYPAAGAEKPFSHQRPEGGCSGEFTFWLAEKFAGLIVPIVVVEILAASTPDGWMKAMDSASPAAARAAIF